MKQKIPFGEAKYKIKKWTPNKDPEKDKSAGDYLVLSGLFIRRGKIGGDLLLADEAEREFEQQLPTL